MDETAAKRPRVILKTGSRATADHRDSAAADAVAAAKVRDAARAPAARDPAPAPRRPAAVASPPPPARRPALPEPIPAQAAQTVQFDVCGQLFKVAAKSIRAKPATHLAKLLEKQGCDSPIFVDTAPERFGCIVDWYRYGEMFVPRNVPIAAVMQDARRLGLPEEVVVNGTLRRTPPNAAHKVGRDLLSSLLRSWRGFEAFFEGVLRRIQAHFDAVARSSAEWQAPRAKAPAEQNGSGGREDGAAGGGEEYGDEEEPYDFPPFVLPLYGEGGWVEPEQISSGPRARAVALLLEERGYCCDFTDAELLVSLPLRLKAEVAGGFPGDEEDELYGEEEAVGHDADEVAA